MKSYNKAIGNLGEDKVADFITKQGYVIIKRNYRCRLGEIDIVAWDGDYLSFLEVKSRYGALYALPREAVNYSKKIKIIKVAQMFILENRLQQYFCRFDVVEVIFNKENNDFSMTIIKDAFQI
jgi:putative endonuclease